MQSEKSFYKNLQQQTEVDRQNLVSATMIQRAINRDITLENYIAYLTQAYHHVKYTVPLMMAVGARLPDTKEWLREAVAEYIEEEIGHQEWILNDIAACGGDKEAVRQSKPAPETELMVAYAFDLIARKDPVGFFGMVHVLEGTSVSLADHAAAQIKQSLGLPEKAFSYLRSHGAIDQKHLQFLEDLLDRFTDPDEQQVIIHSTRMFYRLYKGVFDSLIPKPASIH